MSLTRRWSAMRNLFMLILIRNYLGRPQSDTVIEKQSYLFFVGKGLQEPCVRGTKYVRFQAILFSIAHIGYCQFTSALPFLRDLALVTIMGLMLGYYRQRYDSLIAPFIAHGLVDFLPIFW